LSLIGRARAYLFRRREAYVQTFKGPYAERVLRDLATFCFADISTDDAKNPALAVGRREVWLRIVHHLKLSPDDCWQYYDGRVDDDAS
jgi:hypothetical protein